MRPQTEEGQPVSGSEFELLLRHFGAWAAKKQRTPDIALLDELLHLRSSYDDLPPTYWPEQSVEHLLTERWPAKGPVEAPEPDVVVETLDSFVRFLRSTGRTSARSAAPAVLAKEAKRHAKHLAESVRRPLPVVDRQGPDGLRSIAGLQARRRAGPRDAAGAAQGGAGGLERAPHR